jgi:SAM-dependent methyltransferase
MSGMTIPDTERARLFNDEAERYDRIRPSYPDELIDHVLGAAPKTLKVLDVASGTAKATCQLAARGADVLGVELNPGMAEIAIRHGIPTEISSFESWDPAGRMFDRVTCAQAWHWLDPTIRADKVASVTRTGGQLCLFWNIGHYSDDLAEELQQVYERVLEPSAFKLVIGYGTNRKGNPVADLSIVADELREHGEFAEPATTLFPWARTYSGDEWIDELSSHSDHIALSPPLRQSLFEEIVRTIDGFGGSFVMQYVGLLISASRI